MTLRFVCLLLGAFLSGCVQVAGAAEPVTVCFNYGCLNQVEVEFSDEQLDEVAELLARSQTAEEEREALGLAVGRMLGWAGEQSPIAADRGGNYEDDGVYGRMDCIDHSTTTTRLLRVMERRGWLRFHKVLRPALRSRFIVFQHFAAQIRDVATAGVKGVARRYVVDSWFFDNGQPAVVMPLAAWLAGESPDVE